jgi:hypothetical protein
VIRSCSSRDSTGDILVFRWPGRFTLCRMRTLLVPALVCGRLPASPAVLHSAFTFCLYAATCYPACPTPAFRGLSLPSSSGWVLFCFTTCGPLGGTFNRAYVPAFSARSIGCPAFTARTFARTGGRASLHLALWCLREQMVIIVSVNISYIIIVAIVMSSICASPGDHYPLSVASCLIK